MRGAFLVITLKMFLYLICYFGDNVTERIEDVGTAAYQLAWYVLPVDKQRDLSMLIGASQNGVYIEGIACARCTREIFMRVSLCKSFKR